MTNGLGQAFRRKEDFRLLTGRGCFADDVSLDGQLYGVVARAPHAHARLLKVNTSHALAAPGVHAVLTGADYRADGLKILPSMGNPPDLPLINRNGGPIFVAPDHPLVIDKVRRAGEGIAFVVADTRAHALDAAELIDASYEILPAVTSAHDALVPGAPQVWDQAHANICADAERGDAAPTAAAFARAAHVVELEIDNNRVTGAPMEPRAAVASYDASTGRYTLFYGGQGVTLQRDALAKTLDVSPDRVRTVSRDVGGNFGVRSIHCREHVLIAWASKRLGRPVKWSSDRNESFLIDTAGRDLWARAALALDAQGKFLALRAEIIGNIGAQTINLTPLSRCGAVVTGLYDIPVAHITLKAVFTNTIPISTYRGAGRPEGIYMIERLVDRAAQELRIDPAELRARNLVRAAQLPYRNATGTLYDSGEFGANMRRALELADWSGFPRRRARAESLGRLRGIGIGNYIETATGIPFERVVVSVLPEGRVTMIIGTAASGQGHETSFSQVLAEMLGVPFESIDVRTGDTDFVKVGGGSNSSRSMRIGTFLLDETKTEVIVKAKQLAARAFGAQSEQIEFDAGQFRLSGTNRSMSLFEVAAYARNADLPAELAGELTATASIARMLPTFPNGCHICEVEIDPETGAVEIIRHVGIDDVGRVINPMLVDGQTHGAVVQGLGQALMENCVHDPRSGQLLTGSFMDYAMPRADNVPFFEVHCNEVPAPNKPLGIKGAGEGGTTGAPPAVMNAIIDALRVKDIAMPATPERIWHALRARTGGERWIG
jgi:aerobic carbon-monoxide dehydrogenase large subunit